MRWFWAALFAIGGGVELFALITKHYAWTLSEAMWHWFDVLPGQTIWQWKFGHLVMFVAMVWLTIHFAFRIWR